MGSSQSVAPTMRLGNMGEDCLIGCEEGECKRGCGDMLCDEGEVELMSDTFCPSDCEQQIKFEICKRAAEMDVCDKTCEALSTGDPDMDGAYITAICGGVISPDEKYSDFCGKMCEEKPKMCSQMEDRTKALACLRRKAKKMKQMAKGEENDTCAEWMGRALERC